MSKGLLIIVIFALLGLIAVVNFPDENNSEEKQNIASKVEQINSYTERLMYSQAAAMYRELISEYPSDYDISDKYIAFCEENQFNDELLSEYERRFSLDNSNKELAEKLLDMYYKNDSEDIYTFMDQYDSLLSDTELFSLIEEESLGKFRYIGGALSNVSEWGSSYTLISDADGRKSISSKSGEIIFPYREEILSYSSRNGYIAAKDNGQIVYLDSDGVRRLVPYDNTEKQLIYLDYAGPFGEGEAFAANVELNGVWGYIDESMNMGYLQYEKTTPFSCGISAAKENGKWCILNKDFAEISTQRYDDIYADEYGYCCSNNVIYIKGSSSWQMYGVAFNEEGTTAVSVTKQSELRFDDVRPFGDYGAVKVEDKWGFIKPDGTWLIEPCYDDAYSFRCGLAPVMKNGKWGYISESGKMVIDADYDGAISFSENGVSAVKNDDSWRFIQLNKFYYLWR